MTEFPDSIFYCRRYKGYLNLQDINLIQPEHWGKEEMFQNTEKTDPFLPKFAI